jgi:hypothetical protein
MTTGTKIKSQSSSYGLGRVLNESSSAPTRLEGASGEAENKILMTEGGSGGGVPLLPTIRTATVGAVREVLTDMGVATKDDIGEIEQQMEHLEEKLERIEGDIDPLATEDDIRTMFEAYMD